MPLCSEAVKWGHLRVGPWPRPFRVHVRRRGVIVVGRKALGDARVHCSRIKRTQSKSEQQNASERVHRGLNARSG
eukprot:2321699-Rhodomonas_salina.1